MIRHNSLFPSCRRDLEEAYRAANPAGHWFSAATMRFFKSRIGEVYRVAGGTWVFITSERGPSGARAYTVRTMDTAGDIRDDGAKFQGYPTLGRARTGLKRYAESLTVSV